MELNLGHVTGTTPVRKGMELDRTRLQAYLATVLGSSIFTCSMGVLGHSSRSGVPRTSVADPDPDPPDPHVFGPPGSGSGSISQRYG